MIKKLLNQISKIEQKYGGELPPPAHPKEIELLDSLVNSRFGVKLPKQYISFLSLVNGLDFNGLVVYGVDGSLLQQKHDNIVYGLIETNEIWHENDWQKKYLFFGDSDIGWLCFNISSQKYEEIDKPSGTLMNEYNDFDSMLIDALNERL